MFKHAYRDKNANFNNFDQYLDFFFQNLQFRFFFGNFFNINSKDLAIWHLKTPQISTYFHMDQHSKK